MVRPCRRRQSHTMNANLIITIVFVSYAVLTAAGAGFLAARSWHGVDPDPAFERRHAKEA